jgi:hypothetical protein
MALISGLEAQEEMYRLGSLKATSTWEQGEVVAYLSDTQLVFTLREAGAATVQLQILETGDRVIFDSGPQLGGEIFWNYTGLDWEANPEGKWRYRLEAWDEWSEPLGAQLGEIRLIDMNGDWDPTVTAEAFDNPGDFTVGGYLGVGTDSPVRAVHLKGSNAVFRMDRNQDSAAFMLVRTDNGGVPLKTFVVGVNASGSSGEFIINDLGAAVGGSGNRRMTIDNSGDTTFTGSVTATQYFQSSSIDYKTNVQTVEDPVEMVKRLRGVTFNWKETGDASMGLIAEEVAQVVPEVVSWDESGQQPSGVNYSSLVAVLVEASKVQQQKIEKLDSEIDQLEAEVRAELERVRSGW